MRFITAFVFILLAVGCATLETNSRSLRTGDRTFTVTGFSGNYSNARELAYLRAAQETLIAGFNYFEITRELQNEEEEITTTPGRYEYRTDEDGNEYEEFIPSTTSVSVTYSYILEIRALNDVEKSEYDEKGFRYNDAQTIYDQLAPKWIPEERER
ncbi:MAG: hypothetical protein AAF720_06820 [Pseudomonadota bacterium]